MKLCVVALLVLSLASCMVVRQAGALLLGGSGCLLGGVLTTVGSLAGSLGLLTQALVDSVTALVIGLVGNLPVVNGLVTSGCGCLTVVTVPNLGQVLGGALIVLTSLVGNALAALSVVASLAGALTAVVFILASLASLPVSLVNGVLTVTGTISASVLGNQLIPGIVVAQVVQLINLNAVLGIVIDAQDTICD